MRTWRPSADGVPFRVIAFTDGSFLSDCTVHTLFIWPARALNVQSDKSDQSLITIVALFLSFSEHSNLAMTATGRRCVPW